MEGAALAHVCTHNQMPFLLLRTISDKANEAASIDANFPKPPPEPVAVHPKPLEHDHFGCVSSARLRRLIHNYRREPLCMSYIAS